MAFTTEPQGLISLLLGGGKWLGQPKDREPGRPVTTAEETSIWTGFVGKVEERKETNKNPAGVRFPTINIPAVNDIEGVKLVLQNIIKALRAANIKLDTKEVEAVIVDEKMKGIEDGSFGYLELPPDDDTNAVELGIPPAWTTLNGSTLPKGKFEGQVVHCYAALALFQPDGASLNVKAGDYLRWVDPTWVIQSSVSDNTESIAGLLPPINEVDSASKGIPVYWTGNYGTTLPAGVVFGQAIHFLSSGGWFQPGGLLPFTTALGDSAVWDGFAWVLIDIVSQSDLDFWLPLFLLKTDNLASVASIPTSRTNLDVYSKGESDALVAPLLERKFLDDRKNPGTHYHPWVHYFEQFDLDLFEKVTAGTGNSYILNTAGSNYDWTRTEGVNYIMHLTNGGTAAGGASTLRFKQDVHGNLVIGNTLGFFLSYGLDSFAPVWRVGWGKTWPAIGFAVQPFISAEYDSSKSAKVVFRISDGVEVTASSGINGDEFLKSFKWIYMEMTPTSVIFYIESIADEWETYELDWDSGSHPKLQGGVFMQQDVSTSTNRRMMVAKISLKPAEAYTAPGEV